MLENGLIRKTKTGKLYNISFKFDSEGSVEKVGVRALAAPVSDIRNQLIS